MITLNQDPTQWQVVPYLDFSVQALWTCLDFVDTLKDPDDTFGQGGVHVTEAKAIHA